MERTYRAAVYLRLSKEDEDVNYKGKQVSNSISGQKEVIMDFLKSCPNIEVASVYTDDGYSGVDFDRPEFQRMLSDIRSGDVDCVIVKDLSRFGRNYIESGRYIERIFPLLGIRFIAVMDGYDSTNDNAVNDLLIPFKNLINDAYCRDISVKIRTSFDAKRRNGEYIGAFAAYGYLKDEKDKNHLVIDEYAADVVRDIFSMKLCGMSQQAIADKLNADGILSPYQYKQSIGISFHTSLVRSDEPKWCYNSVLRILKNEVYTGAVVQGKSATPNYKIKKRHMKNESEWIRVEDMHEAIISRKEFELVQKLLLRDTRVAPTQTQVFPLSGMIFCADCGDAMIRKTVPSGSKRYVYYVCAGNKRDRSSCSSHMISREILDGAVLGLIKSFIGGAMPLEEVADIVKNTPVMKPRLARIDRQVRSLQNEMDKKKKRKGNLYRDYKDEILTKSEYIMMKDHYNKAIAEDERRILSLKEEKDNLLSEGSQQQVWLRKLQDYRFATEIDRELLAYLIEKIEVIDKKRLQVRMSFEAEICEGDEMKTMTLEEMKNVDIRTVDPETLVDITTITIDENLPLEERKQEYIRQVKNPYCFRVGDIIVKSVYSNDGVTLRQRFEEFVRSL